MLVLTASQLRNWDQFTIEHEPITSINLMERAARACFSWLEEQDYLDRIFIVFCGKGNNGGDGLAITRMIAEADGKADVYILEFGNRGTEDFQANLERLHRHSQVGIHYIQDESNFPLVSNKHVIIDALFGSGLTRPLEGLSQKLVAHINESGAEVISIDVPSGLSVDQSSKGNTAVTATHTLSFQCYKPALLVAENASHIGEVHILDIGLDPTYYANEEVVSEVTDMSLVRRIYHPRNRFSHKGHFGHALLIAGSYGKIGAAILSARACMRSGAGLLTCHIPQCGYEVLQSAFPEAMIRTDYNSSFVTRIDHDLSLYESIGIGPGIGTASETRELLKELFTNYHRPVVLDADALNCIAQEKNLLNMIPANSILTPHPREFERLFGKSDNDFDLLELGSERSKTLRLVIVLKGHHTAIFTPAGKTYFNDTGNAGMATAGSGDVLTGILTGLLAQGYSPENAALFGVFLHGLAGDIAAMAGSQEAMMASDIVENLGPAFQEISIASRDGN